MARRCHSRSKRCSRCARGPHAALGARAQCVHESEFVRVYAVVVRDPIAVDALAPRSDFEHIAAVLTSADDSHARYAAIPRDVDVLINVDSKLMVHVAAAKMMPKTMLAKRPQMFAPAHLRAAFFRRFPN